MTSFSLPAFLLAVAGWACAAHVVFSGAVTLGIEGVYRHRIFNVSRLSGEPVDRFRMIGSFLRARTQNRSQPVVAFAGSSFTFGYPWQESAIFSQLFANARPDRPVINASVYSGDISSVNDWIVCGARRNGVRFDAIVVEIPVVNTLSSLAAARRAGNLQTSPLADCASGDASPSYFDYVVRRPLAIGWLTALWGSEERPARDLDIMIDPVPDGYFVSAAAFATVQREYEAQIDEMLRHAQSVAPVVYAFPSPVFVAGLGQVGADEQAMRLELDRAVAACSGVPGVRCLDPASFYERRGDFYNLTHLNQRGHREMADWFSRQIDAQ